MYRLSRDIRKYSTTPLVLETKDSNGKVKEEHVLYSPLKKQEGEEFLLQIAEMLNLNLK